MTGPIGAVTPRLRRFGGALLLAATVATAVASGHGARTAAGESLPVQFSRGETLEDGAHATAVEAASYLKAYPRLEARITGHVAPGSDPAAGVALSARRAEIVRNLIAAEGIDEARLHAIGLGSDKPLPRAPDESESAWLRRNARVVIDLEGR